MDSLLLVTRLSADIVETLVYIQFDKILDILEFDHKLRE